MFTQLEKSTIDRGRKVPLTNSIGEERKVPLTNSIGEEEKYHWPTV